MRPGPPPRAPANARAAPGAERSGGRATAGARAHPLLGNEHAGHPEVELLGVRVHLMTVEQMLHRIEEATAGRGRVVIGHHNLHSVHLHHRSAAVRRFYGRADHVFVDGMPLVWWGRLLGLPLRREHRMTSVDWFLPLLQRMAERRRRVFMLGSRPEVAARAAEQLRRRCPGLLFELHHGYFDAAPGSAENQAILARIEAFRPDLLLVGMGMPRQEEWIADNLEHLDVGAALNLGAFLDYVAGAVPTPPRWAARLGFEWLARLIAEPRRLSHRYLVEPWSLLPHAWSDIRRVARGRGERAPHGGAPPARTP